MIKDYSLLAKRQLTNKWSILISQHLIFSGIFVLYFLLTFFLGIYLSNFLSILFYILFFIFYPAIIYGYNHVLYNIYNNQAVKSFDFIIIGFSNFKKAWEIILRTFIKMLKPYGFALLTIIILSIMFHSLSLKPYNDMFITMNIILFCITYFAPFIIIYIPSLFYRQTYWISFDNPQSSSKFAILKSQRLMINNRASLFFLEFSFALKMFLILLLIRLITVFIILPFIILIPTLSNIVSFCISIITVIIEFKLTMEMIFSKIAFYELLSDDSTSNEIKNNYDINNINNNYSTLNNNASNFNDYTENIDFSASEDSNSYDTFDTFDTLETFDTNETNSNE